MAVYQIKIKNSNITFGLEEKNGRIIKIAPVFGFCLGWKIDRFSRYMEGRGEIKKLKGGEDEN